MTDKAENKCDLQGAESAWFFQEYKKRKKSYLVAYYFCLLMSGFGLHKFYLGEKRKAIEFISLYWVGMLIFFAGFMMMEYGHFTAGASIFVLGAFYLAWYGVWWVMDIFTLFLQIHRKNEGIKKELFKKFQQTVMPASGITTHS